MKFTCTRDNLSYVLGLVNGVAQKQTNLPILTNILIQASESKVEVIATNLEIAVKVLLRAKIEMPGSFTVPAKMLLDYVHLLSEEHIHMELKGSELVISSGSSSTKIKGMSAEEYPVIPDVEETHGYVVNAEVFKKSLAQVGTAVAKNEIRPELSGVYMGFFTERYDGLVLAATDSYRLAEKKVPVSQGKDQMKCIVPGRTVSEMVKLLGSATQNEGETDVRLWVSNNQIAIRYDQFEMTSRLVDGKYPDYAQIIPEEFRTTATLPIDVVVKQIKAASLFTTLGINAVSFNINAVSGAVSLTSTSAQTGEYASSIDAEVKGQENSILLNHRYVLDGLQQIQTDAVEFCVNSADAPCLFRPKEEAGYLYIVMPIRQ